MRRFLNRMAKNPITASLLCFGLVAIPHSFNLIDLFWWLRK